MLLKSQVKRWSNVKKSSELEKHVGAGDVRAASRCGPSTKFTHAKKSFGKCWRSSAGARPPWDASAGQRREPHARANLEMQAEARAK